MGNRHAHVNSSVWSHLDFSYKVEGDEAIYLIGEEFILFAEEGYVPCIPKPGVENPIYGLTRIPNGARIMYCGLVEVAIDVMLMHFVYEKENHILLGFNVCKTLTPIAAPQKSKRPPPKSRKRKKRVNKKSPLYLARQQQKPVSKMKLRERNKRNNDGRQEI